VNITSVIAEFDSLVALSSIHAIAATIMQGLVIMKRLRHAMQHISSALTVTMSKRLVKTVLSAANVEERCLPIFAPSVNTSLVWIKTLITVTNAEFAESTRTNHSTVRCVMCVWINGSREITSADQIQAMMSAVSA